MFQFWLFSLMHHFPVNPFLHLTALLLYSPTDFLNPSYFVNWISIWCVWKRRCQFSWNSSSCHPFSWIYNYIYLKTILTALICVVFLFSIWISLLLVSSFHGLSANILLDAGYHKLNTIEFLGNIMFPQRDFPPPCSGHLGRDSLSCPFDNGLSPCFFFFFPWGGSQLKIHGCFPTLFSLS